MSTVDLSSTPRPLLKRARADLEDSSLVIWSCSWLMDDDGLKWCVVRLDGSRRVRLARRFCGPRPLIITE